MRPTGLSDCTLPALPDVAAGSGRGPGPGCVAGAIAYAIAFSRLRLTGAVRDNGRAEPAFSLRDGRLRPVRPPGQTCIGAARTGRIRAPEGG